MTSEDLHYVLGNLDGLKLDGDILPDRDVGLLLGRDIVYIIENACDRQMSSRGEVASADEYRTFYRPVTKDTNSRLERLFVPSITSRQANGWFPSIFDGQSIVWNTIDHNWKDMLFPERYEDDEPPAYRGGIVDHRFDFIVEKSEMLKYFECLDEMRFTYRTPEETINLQGSCLLSHGENAGHADYPPGFVPEHSSPLPQSGPGSSGRIFVSRYDTGSDEGIWTKSSIATVNNPSSLGGAIYTGRYCKVRGFVHWHAEAKCRVVDNGHVQTDDSCSIFGLTSVSVYTNVTRTGKKTAYIEGYNIGSLINTVKSAITNAGVHEIDVAGTESGMTTEYRVVAEIIDPIIVLDYSKEDE